MLKNTKKGFTLIELIMVMIILGILVVIFLISTFVISKRENLNQIENSLENILNIQKF